MNSFNNNYLPATNDVPTAQYVAPYTYPMGMPTATNPYGVEVDCYGNPILDPVTSNALYAKSKLMEQEHAYEMGMEQQKLYNEIERLHIKEAIEIRKAEVIEKRRRAYEDATLSPALNNEGKIFLLRVFTDGRSEVASQPLFKYGNIKFTKILSVRTETVVGYHVTWEGLDEEIILPKHATTHQILNAFQKAGNPIIIGKNRKSEVGDLVVTFLLNTARNDDNVMYLLNWGWQKVHGDWHFNIEYNQALSDLMEKNDENL